MKAALSLTLVLALMTSGALPVTAQERIDATASPISGAITFEAIRLAAEPVATESNSDAQAPAQSVDDLAWSRVQGLSKGDEVRVARGNGAFTQGAFRTADATSITLLVAGREQNTARADVRQVSVVGDTDRWQHVVTGLVIGGVIGVIAVALHCRGESSSCKEVAPAYFAPAVGIGAAIGTLLPPRTHWHEIYSRSAA